MTTGNCAVMCPSGPLRGSSLSAVLDTAGVSLSDTTVITGAPPSTAGMIYGKVIVIGLQNPPVTMKEVQAACTHLKSGGQLVLVVPSSQASGKRLVVMSGCTAATTSTVDVEGLSCSITSAAKPDVSFGAKSAISSAETASTWKIAIDADDEDLLDDDDLLTEEDRKPVEPPKNDCSTSKKACANCSCGRADAEAAGVKLQLTQDMIENPQSACGSTGKKIELPSDFLLADA